MGAENELLAHLLVDSVKELKNLHFTNEKQIKHSEMMLLIKLNKYLKEEKQSTIRTTDVSKILGLSPSTITPIINSLEEKGYIERIFDKTDRRVVFLQITKEGLKLEKELNQKMMQKSEYIVNYLGEKDTKEFIRILQKILDCMKTT